MIKDKNDRLLKILSIVLMMILSCLMIFGCGKKTKNQENKTINIIIQSISMSDKEPLSKLLEAFKEENKDYILNINFENNEEKIIEDINNKKYDLMICSRNLFLRTAKKGMIKDMTGYFNNKNANDKFYNICLSYGRYGDKYLGLGLFPYSIDILYNEKAVRSTFGNINSEEIMDFKNIIKDNNFKIPVVIPEELNLNDVISILVANNIVKESDLVDVYNSGKDKYLEVDYMQEIFEGINKIHKEFNINERNFELDNIDAIQKLESGEIPFLLATSLVGRENINSSNIKVINTEKSKEYKTMPPVCINHIICATSNNKNKEGIESIFNYLMIDKNFEKLAEEGYITGNKQSDTNIKGLNSKLIWSVSGAKDNNIPYIKNLPSKFIEPLDAAIDKILKDGEYTGEEWNNIVNDIYPVNSK